MSGWVAGTSYWAYTCKCSLMAKTDRGAEGKRGTINQHLFELTHLVWSDVSSPSRRHWTQTSYHRCCSMTVGMIACFATTTLLGESFFYFFFLHFSVMLYLFFFRSDNAALKLTELSASIAVGQTSICQYFSYKKIRIYDQINYCVYCLR